MPLDSLTFTKETKSQVNFLSKIFATFNQDIIKIWCDNPNNKQYNYVSREPIIVVGEERTRLDHLLEKNGKNFIVEQKNFFGYKGGLITIIDDDPIFLKNFDSWSNSKNKDQKSQAWQKFSSLHFKKNLEPFVKLKNGEIKIIHGKILIWSKGTKEGKKILKHKLYLNDILTIEDMVIDLKKWGDADFKKLLKEKKKWINNLFSELIN